MGKGIFLNIPSTGHINPSLAVISELVNCGEDIIYVLTDEYEAKVKQTGARFVPYPQITELIQINEIAASGNIPRNAHTLVQIGEQLLPFVIDLIDREQPDYLIYDSLCGWGLMASRKFPHLPSVATFSTFVVDIKSPPPLGIRDIIKTAGQLLGEIGGYWQTRRRIQQQFGISSVGLMEAVSSQAQMNLVYTSRQFQPGGNSYGDSYKFVGPCIAERHDSLDFPQDFLDNKPLIYISLGTVNNANLDFFKNCVQAFKDFPAYFVMSIGKQQRLESIGEIPNNFLIRNFVPQLEVLKHTDVFVTHGGLNSVHEGLLENVPLIVIPQQVEQGIIGRQVVKFGAGKSLPRSFTIQQLRETVQDVLKNHASYRQEASRLGHSLSHAGGAKQAVDEILRFVNYKKLK